MTTTRHLLTLLALAMALTGCAVCEQHRTACTVVAVSAGVIVAGLAAQHHNAGRDPTRSQIPGSPDCTSNPNLCK